MIADDLRRQADAFVDLADLLPRSIGRAAHAARSARVLQADHAERCRDGGRRANARPDTPEPPRDCPLCPRLVAYRAENRAEHPDWFNGPAPSFGDPNARLLVAGLAPGRTGANRTGRPFTGDGAGLLLYETLIKTGFARGRYEARPDDGLKLVDCMITNAVRCAPPGNKPLPSRRRPAGRS